MAGVARVFAHILLSLALRRKKSQRRSLRKPLRKRMKPLERKRKSLERKRIILKRKRITLAILNLKKRRGDNCLNQKRNTKCLVFN